MAKRHSKRVLIVDDEEANRRLFKILLEKEAYDTRMAVDGTEALRLVDEYGPDLILLDVMMPVMDGFEVATKLKDNPETQHIPIIMLTMLDDRESRLKGLEAGAEEYLAKPVDAMDLLVRVRNLIQMKELNDFLKNHNKILEKEVRRRTSKIRKQGAQLQDSFVEAICALMRAAEYRDDETGAHVKRISHYTRVLAEKMGMDKEFCDMIFYASPMHDIGKIGITDNILLKPDRFTPEEWEIMKAHTTIGAGILAGTSSPYLEMGQKIALSHHERWDGGGYPQRIKGDDIPLPARIMQICDVYDALRSKRPYKPAFDHVKTMEIIVKGDGRTDPAHFDPAVLSAFKSCADMHAEIFAGRNEPEET